MSNLSEPDFYASARLGVLSGELLVDSVHFIPFCFLTSVGFQFVISF